MSIFIGLGRASRLMMTDPDIDAQPRTLRLVGTIPPEVWNRLGTRIIPKLLSGSNLKMGVAVSVTVSAASAGSLASDLQQVVQELGLTGMLRIE